YPAEVEAALKAHSAVADAVVFGVADPAWGAAIKAVCVLRRGFSATTQEIIDFVAARIARYKRPKHLVIVTDLQRRDEGALYREKNRQKTGRRRPRPKKNRSFAGNLRAAPGRPPQHKPHKKPMYGRGLYPAPGGG
ncbi:UNVERIFIED_CONTAM: hypothetical protein NY603_17670, partial [Bacteroidetes bacterium 56_B9]